MSTDVDTSTPPPTDPAPRRRARYVWLAVLLVVALGGLVALNRSGVLGGDSPTGAAGRGDGFDAQLAAKVVNVLEQTPAADHGHGAHYGLDGGPTTTVCGVRIFGRNPANSDTVEEVAQVYAYHLCAIAQPGGDWTFAPKMTGPVVVTLAGDPPTVSVAEGGEGFRERVQKLIPAQYHEEAFKETLTPEAMQELMRRYDEAARK